MKTYKKINGKLVVTETTEKEKSMGYLSEIRKRKQTVQGELASFIQAVNEGKLRREQEILDLDEMLSEGQRLGVTERE
jgi:hypothetical protein